MHGIIFSLGDLKKIIGENQSFISQPGRPEEIEAFVQVPRHHTRPLLAGTVASAGLTCFLWLFSLVLVFLTHFPRQGLYGPVLH